VQVLEEGVFYRFDATVRRFVPCTSLAIDDAGRIASLVASDIGANVKRISMGGATIVPAFADCHVHLTDAGFFLGPRDLSGVRSYNEFVGAVARIPNDANIVFAGQYDESQWSDGRLVDAAPLDRNHGDALAMLVRIDGHSCVVNRKTLDWLAMEPDTQGIERDSEGHPTGKFLLAANWIAQSRFQAQFSLEQRRAAERRAVDLALSRGALHLHAQLYGFAREQYLHEVAAMQSLPAKIYPKICEPDPQLAVELELPFIGGDIFLDGSLGSGTAAQSEPYADSGECGKLRMSDREVETFFAAAESLGIAAGVHAIGDAAIDQAVRAWERVLGGQPSQRGTRHFIEHFECATAAHIEACASMGIYLSMQPQFDALWGGPGGMYEARLGTERMRTMNALGSAVRSGATLCGGDDAPVCALDPLAGMRAGVEHHEPEERLSVHEALAAYTVNAARLGYAERETGNLDVGLAADLVVLDRDPLRERFRACRVLQTWRDGQPVYAR
jgi:predicted amidohydrolase YtcJ